MNSKIIETARQFAAEAHRGQVRKYTRVPYIEHPIAVAKLVADTGAGSDVIAGALLHDVVEDTPVCLEEIGRLFGTRIMRLVSEVTDVSRPTDGNRKARKALDRLHLAEASPEGKTIKLADLIDNTTSIVRYDPGFAKVYMAEKRSLLPVLVEGNAKLYEKARRIVESYFMITS